jgi:hypothetical protein
VKTGGGTGLKLLSAADHAQTPVTWTASTPENEIPNVANEGVFVRYAR